MKKPLNQYIDHTLLKPEATEDEITQLCRECVENKFASVFVNPTWILHAKSLLKDTEVSLCSVVGFPLGANTTDTKAHEAHHLASLGVDEIDMVMNIGALKSKDFQKVRKDIEAVVKNAPSILIKVIIETCVLNDEEKTNACKIVVESGASFVKTSTGFAKAGATIHDVALMRKVVGPDFGVKASGGIRDLQTALAMIEAGTDRIGTSAGVAIVKGQKTLQGSY